MAYNVPQVDFSSLGDLPRVYREAKMNANRERTLADLGQGSPIGEVARRLFQAGDIQGGLSLAQLANAQAQQDWTKTYQGGMLDVARQSANRRETPPQLQVLDAAGIDPKSPAGHKALFPKTDTPISAADKKAIFEAEDENLKLDGTIDSLKRAKELNQKTFTGVTAGARGWLGTSVPGAGAVIDKGGAEATREFGQLMSGEAIKTMAATLKGATTDFEMRKFESLMADPTTPPAIRDRMIDRMLTLAEKQKGVNEARTKDLRTGEYFKPPGGGNKSLPRVNSPAEAAKLPKGTRFLDPNGVERVVP